MRSGYSPLQKFLHWLTVLLIIAQWWTSAAIYRTHAHNPFGVQPDPIDLFEHKLHIYGGLLILALTILRLVIRWRTGVPALPDGLSSASEWLARWGHAGLYLILFGLTATGIVTSYLWFGMGRVHELLVKGLYGLVLLHVGATIWHEVVDSVSILRRMVPSRWMDGAGEK